MFNNNTMHNYFVSKWELKMPIHLTNMSQGNNNIVFYNSNTGSALEILKTVSFKYQPKK